MRNFRTYTELKMLNTFEERYNFLKLLGKVGQETFGFDRYMNQAFYQTPEWKTVRREVIVRDNGFDMGLFGYDIVGKIIVHHMNPITIEDIEELRPELFDPEFLISVSEETHNAIHYGDRSPLPRQVMTRAMGDTTLW